MSGSVSCCFSRLTPIIFSFALISIFTFFSPCKAMQAVHAPESTGKGKQTKSAPSHMAHPAPKYSVENVFVDRIEEGALYSKDGRTFAIGGAKLIDNSRKSSGRKAAELFFEDGSLMEVILK